jgi:hypothetical protein
MQRDKIKKFTNWKIIISNFISCFSYFLYCKNWFTLAWRAGNDFCTARQKRFRKIVAAQTRFCLYQSHFFWHKVLTKVQGNKAIRARGKMTFSAGISRLDRRRARL